MGTNLGTSYRSIGDVLKSWERKWARGGGLWTKSLRTYLPAVIYIYMYFFFFTWEVFLRFLKGKKRIWPLKKKKNFPNEKKNMYIYIYIYKECRSKKTPPPTPPTNFRMRGWVVLLWTRDLVRVIPHQIEVQQQAIVEELFFIFKKGVSFWGWTKLKTRISR